jgi:hypothetical protein
MQNTHYKSHNQKMLVEIAGDQHNAWLKERDQRALKRAKRDIAPAKGKTLNSLAQLKGI